MKIKNVIATLLGFMFYFIFRTAIFPWDNHTSHIAYNDAILEIFITNYESFFPSEYTIKITDDEEKYKGMAVTNPGFTELDYTESEMDYKISEWIIHGGYSADEPELQAAVRHFYDPIGLNDGKKYLTNQGTSWEWMYPNPHIDAISWAMNGEDYKWSLNKGKQYLISALEEKELSIKNDNLVKAFRSLGEVLHNTADMGCPAHVRNDSHPAPINYQVAKIFGSPDPTEELFTGGDYVSLYMDYAPDQNLESFFNSAKTIRSIHEKLAEFTNANFFTTQTMNGTGVTPINSDGYYRKPLLHELDYDASDFTYYKLLPDGNKIKMAKDKIYFASRGNPYIDHECVKSQASLLVPNIIWAGINVVRLFIPKFDVTIKSVAADGEIKGTVKHIPTDEYTSDINYTGKINIYDSESSQMIGELNCNSGDFVGTISNLGNHTEIYANMEIAGISIHSKDFKIGDTTPGVTGKPCPGIPTLTYEGKTYNTVQIGNQCWLKENLDIGTMINGSVSQTDNNIIEKYCYNDDISNCNTFGGLYQWNEAMKYSTTEGTKGICPDDWHIPTYADLLILYESVEISDNALEAGSNTSGFSALLAGTYYNGFYGLGNETHIWNSSELNSISAHALYISPQKYSSSIDFYGKTSSFSVRCIKDDGTSSSGNQAPNIPSSPNPSNGAKDQPTNVSLFWTCNDPDSDPLTYDIYFGTNNVPPLVESNHSGTSYNPGTLEGNTQYYWEIVAKDNNGNDRTGPDWEFTTGSSTSLGSSCPGIPTVTYAGKTYNTVQIGEQCWLKENLNVGTLIDQKVESMNNSIIEKFCYNNEEANCEKYGGLYQWAEAMEYVNSEGNKGICPNGWHIPSRSEFETLKNEVGSDGNALKAIGEGNGNGLGTNTSGFSALLSSNREEDGTFYTFGYYAYFWSSTEYGDDFATHLQTTLSDDNIELFLSSKGVGFNIRCLKD